MADRTVQPCLARGRPTGVEVSSKALAPVEYFITGIRQLSKTDLRQCGVIHRDGVLDASAVFSMALLATADVPMKRGWSPLEQRFVVRVANDTV